MIRTHHTSRTDLPYWSDVTRDECGQPTDKIIYERDYEPEMREAISDLDEGFIGAHGFAERINRIFLHAAGQMDLDFDAADLALFSDLGGAA